MSVKTPPFISAVTGGNVQYWTSDLQIYSTFLPVFTDGINLASSFTNLITGLGLKLMIGADGVPVENMRMCLGVHFFNGISLLFSKSS